MKITLAHAPTGRQLDDDQIVPDDLVGRLYGAGESGVADVVAGFSHQQRANLAMFFYRRAHLHQVGLAIAATCDRTALVQAWGTALGHALFTQSRDRMPARAPGPYRPQLKLAEIPAFHLGAALAQEKMVDRIAA
jgi:hypothetical protein